MPWRAAPPTRRARSGEAQMIETPTFSCSICGEPSTEICVYCTKDACSNHRCDRCHRCSDCCGCEVRRTYAEPGEGNHAN